jgi:transposase, IS5 family
MAEQLSFGSLDFAAKKKRTKRDVFLGEMAGVVPWAKLEALIEPHYPRLGPQGGRRTLTTNTTTRELGKKRFGIPDPLTSRQLCQSSAQLRLSLAAQLG